MIMILQRFVVRMYDRTSPLNDVNESRRILFTRKSRAIERIPPTLNTLVQHTKRAALQARIWTSCLTCLKKNYNYLSPVDWGGQEAENERYELVWVTN